MSEGERSEKEADRGEGAKKLDWKGEGREPEQARKKKELFSLSLPINEITSKMDLNGEASIKSEMVLTGS